MMNSFEPSWQKSRKRWNHDWLKNRWIPAISAYCRVLAGEVIDDSSTMSIYSRLNDDFLPGCTEVRGIINRFRQEMSPRLLFQFAPLSHCDTETLRWLPEVTEQLWLSKYGVDQITRAAAFQLEQTETAARDLLQAIREGQRSDSVVSLSQKLLNACVSLSEGLSAFPDQIV